MSEKYINVNNTRLVRQINNKLLSPVEKHLLEVIGGYAHDDGSNIRPSIKTLMEDTGYGRTCIKDTIKAVVTKNFLIKTITQRKGSHKPHQYSLNLNLIMECQSNKFIDNTLNTEVISKSPHDPDLGHEATQTRPCSDLDIGRQVTPNKYLRSNEKVIEQIPIASSSGVCDSSPNMIPSPKKTKFEPCKIRSNKQPDPSNNTAWDIFTCTFPGIRQHYSPKDRLSFDKAVDEAGGGDLGRQTILDVVRWEQHVRAEEVRLNLKSQYESEKYTPSIKKYLEGRRWKIRSTSPIDEDGCKNSSRTNSFSYKTAHEKRDEEIIRREREQKERLAKIASAIQDKSPMNQLMIHKEEICNYETETSI